MRSSILIWKFFLILLNIIIFQASQGQVAQTSSFVYKVNRKTEIPLTVGLFIINEFGYNYIHNKTGLDSMEILRLDANDIWKFDQFATKQDVAYKDRARRISDIGLYFTIALPAFLMLDNKIQKDWIDLLVLYGETHAIATSLHVLTTGIFDRIRPFVYNPDVTFSDKTGSGTQTSFYSGHVSSTATASFFMAKVYSDYHPELGNKKLWLFSAALIPPAFVGYYRIKGMKHFPSDVIVGTALGACTGILIPHLHKIQNKNNDLTFMPYAGKITGLKIRYAIN
ncbi:phosphatase PAP2 family protein [Bacteroidota bacterium]